jgi:hypothetical protein
MSAQAAAKNHNLRGVYVGSRCGIVIDQPTVFQDDALGGIAFRAFEASTIA